MATSPLTEMDRILQMTNESLVTAEEKTKQENLSTEALMNLTADLNANLNDSLNQLQNVRLGTIKLNQQLRNKVSNILFMIAAFNNNRQVIESRGGLKTTLKKLETILKNFKIGEKVEPTEQNPL